MNRVAIDIDRLELTLSGVSADVGQQAAERLGTALSARLAARTAGRLTPATLSSASMQLAPIAWSDAGDAAALADSIAERLIDAFWGG